jgi:hypothetical protein
VRRLRTATLIALLTGLVGCTQLSAHRDYQSLPLLSPATFGVEASALQRLSVTNETDGAMLVLDAAVEVDSQQLRVAGFLLGQRILLLSWDGDVLQEMRDPVVPKSLNGRAILRDLQLVYWPVAAVRAALRPGWRLEEQASERRLYYGAGLILESKRHDTVPLGDAQLWNHLEHYRIDIKASNDGR